MKTFIENLKQIFKDKFLLNINKRIWWRCYFKKHKLTEQEANSGRCLLCHAGVQVNKDIPRCCRSKTPCPCKWNECLKIKKEIWS